MCFVFFFCVYFSDFDKKNKNVFQITFIVFIGMKYVVRTSVLILACSLLSILSVYVGVAVDHFGSRFDVCVVDDRLVSMDFVGNSCAPENPTMAEYFCRQQPSSGATLCDPYYDSAVKDGSIR
jgi:hypothetical protein